MLQGLDFRVRRQAQAVIGDCRRIVIVFAHFPVYRKYWDSGNRVTEANRA